MGAFIYAELSQALNNSYQKPVLELIKKQFSSFDYLDLDNFSEEFLIMQTCQLVELADTCVVYFKSLAPEAPLGATLRLAEVLIRRQHSTLVVLQGTHTRLERLFNNRPTLTFLKNPTESRLQQHLNLFYTDA